jgi:uncharacterized protein YfdQ (DUF2303 family)
VLTAPHLKDGSLIVAAPKEDKPRFLTACPTFHDPGAFNAYVNAFKQTATRLFYMQDGNFLAVFDYHSAAPIPAFGDHKAILALKRSPEWAEWAKHSGEAMGQQAFAEFIEDNARDILQPDPETMLRVASGLHATVGATFRQATNQANGQIQLSFDETINGTVNGKEEAIPTTFQVGLRPFMGCERYPVDCRLRYRIERSSGAALKLHFKALHLDPITEAALEGIVARVRDETGIAPALGMHNSDAFARGV